MIVILALGDKGCSAEGGLTGTINNMATQNGFLDNVATMLQHIDELGSPLHENQSFENSKCCGTPGRKNIFWHASQADEDIWCAPELLRAQAHRLVLSGGGLITLRRRLFCYIHLGSRDGTTLERGSFVPLRVSVYFIFGRREVAKPGRSWNLR